MWQCKNCNEQIEDNFTDCWNCGFSKEGMPCKIGFINERKTETNIIKVDVPNRMMKVIQIISCVIGILLMGIYVLLAIVFVIGGSGGASHSSSTIEFIIGTLLFLLNLPTVIIAIFFRDSISSMESFKSMFTILIVLAAVFQGSCYYFLPVIIKGVFNFFSGKKN